MNELIRLATVELANFLSASLPELSSDWWKKHVVDRLSFQQQRMVQDRGYKSLKQLDFAALLRILDQNWYELSSRISVSREGRNWVKELQTVRNKWAHLSAEAMPPGEVFRDIDTLGRLLTVIGASEATLKHVEESKAATVAAMTNATKTSAEPPASNAVSQRPIVANESVPLKNETPKSEGPTIPASLFNVGDLVALRSNPELVLPVIEVISGGGERRYRVFQNNAKQTYYESQLQAPPQAGDERKPLSTVELHAHLTSLHILSPSTANLFSLRSGRVNFVPYQYRPVLKLIRADRPRLLIADEVGVGKTIEAGLIIKELRARLDLSSVLIICPKALVAERKWAIEMKRFDEHFTPLDGKSLKHCLRETELEGEWPEQHSKAILPFSLFDAELVLGRDGDRRRKGQGLVDLDPPPKFDLVIVDEAHHIRNSETYLHQGIRYFCDNAEAVLFLTATPVQLGSDDLYTLLRVLRPDLVIDRASFEQMAAPNRFINSAVQHCRNAKTGWQQEARNDLDAVAQTEWGRLFVRESPAFQGIYDRLRAEPIPDDERIRLVRATEELYTFSSLINRTRRRDIGEFTSRLPETISVDFTTEQQKLHDGLLSVISRILAYCHGRENVKFMMSTIRRQAASCLFGLAPMLKEMLTGKLERLEPLEMSDDGEEPDLSFVDEVRSDVAELIAMSENLDKKDPKVEEFVAALAGKGRMPNNKALVFSTFRHTLAYLSQHAQRTGLRTALIHGSVPDEERADLRRRFALPKEQPDAVDVLLSSEVGCEGLDFQFCDFLINYDLPWNPMRIEQRIGRIDRYGQKSESVAIINFVTPGTVEAEIYERCLLRIGVFRHSIGGSEEILGRISQQLREVSETFTLNSEERDLRLQQIADNSIRKIQEDEELEKKETELFGLNIPNAAWRKEIEDAENYWLSSAAMERCVTAYLATRVGTETENLLGRESLKTLRINQEARNKLLEDYKALPRSTDVVSRDWEKWLKGSLPTLPVTFDQETAVENPKAAHLSVMHPLIRQAARSPQLADPAYAVLNVQTNKVAPGTYLFAVYRWKKHGARLDESLVPVASEVNLEACLFELLQSAQDVENPELPPQSDFDALDAAHHAKWTTAQANHIAENQQQVEHRIQSLTVSHRARCQLIEDQVARANNDKIRLMKQSEMARAHADFSRRMDALQQAVTKGDIHASPVLFGAFIANRGAK